MGNRYLYNSIIFLLLFQFFHLSLYSMSAEAKNFYAIVAVVGSLWIGRNIWLRHQKAKAHQIELESRVEQLERQIKFCYFKKNYEEGCASGIMFDPELYMTKDIFVSGMQDLNQKISEFATEMANASQRLFFKCRLLEENLKSQVKSIDDVRSKSCLDGGEILRLKNLFDPLDSQVRANELIIRSGLECTKNQIDELFIIYENSVDLYKKNISNIHATMQQIVCTLNERLPKENKLNNLEIKALVDAPYIKIKEDLDSALNESCKGKKRSETGCSIC